MLSIPNWIQKLIFLCISTFYLFFNSPFLIANATQDNVSEYSDEDLLKEAKKFAQENNYEDAVSIYKNLSEKYPQEVDYLKSLGLLNVRLGRKKEAIQLYRRALIIDPNNQEIEIALSFAYLFENDLQKSEEIFKNVLQKSPSNPDALAGIGYINMLKGDESEAEKYFYKALESDSKHISARIYLGNLRIRQHLLPQAKEIFEQLKKEDPNNQDIEQGLLSISQLEKEEAPNLDKENTLTKEDQLIKEANDLRAEKKYEDAATLYEELLKSHPENVDYLLALGKLYVSLNRKNDAIDLYEHALRLEPDRQDVKAALGFAYLFENNLQDSQKLFEELLEQDPNNVDALAGLGNIALKLSKLDQSENYLLKAIEIDPNHETALIYLAALKMRQNNYIEANEIYRKIVEIDPNNSDAFALIGRIAAIQKHPEEAEEYYQKALEIDPNNVTTLEFLAILKLEQKKYDEAFAIYSKLLSIDPLNKDYAEGFHNAKELPLVERAKKLRKNKDNEAAAAIVEQLITLSPDKIEYYLMLGLIYVNMGKKDDAIDLYNHALARKPNDKDVLRALGFIYLNKALDDVAEGTFKWSSCFPFLSFREKTNLYLGKAKFREVLAQDPQDASAMAGIGRIALIDGFPEIAEKYYFESLNIEPKNTTALSYLAALQSMQKKYYTADSTYQLLMGLDPDDEDTRNNYRDFLHIKNPSIDLSGYYEEENEKNQITEVWEARLKNYGGAVTFIYSLKDQLKLVGNISFDYIVLKNLLPNPFLNSSIYSFDIQRPKVGFIWTYSPYLTISGGLGFSIFSKYHQSATREKGGCYFLPYMNVSYSKNFHTCYFETIGDSPIVARDFITNESTLIARQFLNAFYEYDFTKRRAIGVLASYAWYNNKIKDNQYQFASAWVQLTPPCFYENISLRYQFNYGRFSDLTIDYYTYQPQTSHWIKLDFTKKWFDGQVEAAAGYAHCWQRSFENGQIISVTPVAFFHWIHREIDAAYAKMKFVFNDRLNASILGTYSHDTFDYTTASISANIHMEF